MTEVLSKPPVVGKALARRLGGGKCPVGPAERGDVLSRRFELRFCCSF